MPARALSVDPNETPRPKPAEPDPVPPLPDRFGPGAPPTGSVVVLPLVLTERFVVLLQKAADRRGISLAELIQRAAESAIREE